MRVESRIKTRQTDNRTLHSRKGKERELQIFLKKYLVWALVPSVWSSCSDSDGAKCQYCPMPLHLCKLLPQGQSEENKVTYFILDVGCMLASLRFGSNFTAHHTLPFS